MAEKCVKCSVVIDSAIEKDDVAQCSECKGYFHSACCSLQNWATWSKTRAKKAAWKCDICKAESASAHSEASSNTSSVMAVLQDMRREIADNMKESRGRFDSLETSILSVRASIEESQGRIKVLEEENNKLREENEARKQEIAETRDKTAKIQLELLEMQQYSRRHNIEIRGVPTSHGENVYVILEQIAAALGIQWNRWDFSIAHRLQRPASGYPAIIAVFTNRSVREEWLTAARLKKIKTTDISPRLSPGPVYINSHLTIHNKQLLGRAKQLVRDRKLANAWVADGRVLVRRMQGGHGLRVSVMEDLDKYAE